VTKLALTGVEQAILQILDGYPGGKIPGRELRARLRSRGFRRSAPALVFTMMRLQDKGLVHCLETVREADGREITERSYSRVTRSDEIGRHSWT
jgi:repressor of nif and glnA expression